MKTSGTHAQDHTQCSARSEPVGMITIMIGSAVLELAGNMMAPRSLSGYTTHDARRNKGSRGGRGLGLGGRM